MLDTYELRVKLSYVLNNISVMSGHFSWDEPVLSNENKVSCLRTLCSADSGMNMGPLVTSPEFFKLSVPVVSQSHSVVSF